MWIVFDFLNIMFIGYVLWLLFDILGFSLKFFKNCIMKFLFFFFLWVMNFINMNFMWILLKNLNVFFNIFVLNVFMFILMMIWWFLNLYKFKRLFSNMVLIIMMLLFVKIFIFLIKVLFMLRWNFLRDIFLWVYDSVLWMIDILFLRLLVFMEV